MSSRPERRELEFPCLLLDEYPNGAQCAWHFFLAIHSNPFLEEVEFGKCLGLGNAGDRLPLGTQGCERAYVAKEIATVDIGVKKKGGHTVTCKPDRSSSEMEE